jgi:hypothetical protein
MRAAMTPHLGRSSITFAGRKHVISLSIIDRTPLVEAGAIASFSTLIG